MNKDELMFKARCFFQNFRDGVKVQKNRHLLELEENGYTVITDFIDSDKAENWALRLNELYNDQNQKYVSVFSNGADLRIFGVERLSQTFSKFTKNPDLENDLSMYVGHPIETLFTMSGNISKTSEDSVGSGDGWHRDSFQIQVKSFLFLDDVSSENGPLQVIPKTHKLSSMTHMIKLGLMGWRQHRYDQDVIDKYLSATNLEAVSLTCKKGTLVLADTRMLHRGAPLKSGSRMALTNYQFMRGRESQKKAKYFSDVLLVE
jgi:ectoine hydroxylase-related dioxygenase (phytanoyl-CoA dioxygenase family)